MITPDTIFQFFLNQSRSVISLTFTKKWKIIDHNSYMLNLLGLKENQKGKYLSDLLQEQSMKIVSETRNNTFKVCPLVFKGTNNAPISLDCTIFAHSPESMIVGEKPVLTNDETMHTLSAINNEIVNLTRDLQKKNRQLEQANATIKTLRGILPICSFCKGIRDDEGYWKKLEEYIMEETEVEFSHGVCPECMKKHYPDIGD